MRIQFSKLNAKKMFKVLALREVVEPRLCGSATFHFSLNMVPGTKFNEFELPTADTNFNH